MLKSRIGTASSRPSTKMSSRMSLPTESIVINKGLAISFAGILEDAIDQLSLLSNISADPDKIEDKVSTCSMECLIIVTWRKSK